MLSFNTTCSACYIWLLGKEEPSNTGRETQGMIDLEYESDGMLKICV